MPFEAVQGPYDPNSAGLLQVWVPRPSQHARVAPAVVQPSASPVGTTAPPEVSPPTPEFAAPAPTLKRVGAPALPLPDAEPDPDADELPDAAPVPLPGPPAPGSPPLSTEGTAGEQPAQSTKRAESRVDFVISMRTCHVGTHRNPGTAGRRDSLLHFNKRAGVRQGTFACRRVALDAKCSMNSAAAAALSAKVRYAPMCGFLPNLAALENCRRDVLPSSDVQGT